MGIGKVVVGWTKLHLARFLATKVATPLILTGTLALAAGGAVATTPTQQIPTYPNSSCHTNWYGGIACRIPAGQVASYPNAHCHPSWRHPGMDICHFWSNESN